MLLLPFGAIRIPALQLWLNATGRVRNLFADDFAGSFECQWQSGFGAANPNDDTHYSIFCSLGDFNTNITDLLTDERFDDLLFHPNNGEILFRYYSRIFLIASEILTDFQDILIVFRYSSITAPRNRAENDISRNQLTPPGNPGAMQSLFDFINAVFKHKTRNIHSCNHHMKYHFVDSGDPMPANDTITMQNVVTVLDKVRNNTISKLPENVVVPPLVQVLGFLIDGYNIIHQIFQADPAKFAAFCTIYEGKSSVTPPPVPMTVPPELPPPAKL